MCTEADKHAGLAQMALLAEQWAAKDTALALAARKTGGGLVYNSTAACHPRVNRAPSMVKPTCQLNSFDG